MNVKINDIINRINEFAPEGSQEEWDNSGLQIGWTDDKLDGILLCMDITDKVVDYAIENSLNLIISHHPFFFDGIKSIDYNNYRGKLINKVIKNNINIYSSHTSLDISKLGVNTTLANLLGLKNLRKINDENYNIEDEIGVVGDFENNDINNLLDKIKKFVPEDYIRLYGKMPNKFKSAMVVGGSGVFALDYIKDTDIDILVSGDVKHHDGQRAYEYGKLLIDISHFYSELPVLYTLKDILSKDFSNILIYDNPDFFIDSKEFKF